MSTVFYCVRQGFRNFIRKPLFTFASTATVGACIFLVCMFIALAENLEQAVLRAENCVGITVFFEEDAGEEKKAEIRNTAEAYGGVREIRYISAEEAWESFRTAYFGDRAEELTAAFEGENPLASSDSFEIYTEKIEDQPGLAAVLEKTPGVREVRYASSAVAVLKKFNSGLKLLFTVIIGVLFAVSVFLISTTIRVAAEFRRKETEIMKLIGARNAMIRAPFVIEGLLIGLVGAAVPLIAVRVLYSRLSLILQEQLASLSVYTALGELFELIPPKELFPHMAAAAAILGLGMGVLVSSAAISRHLREKP